MAYLRLENIIFNYLDVLVGFYLISVYMIASSPLTEAFPIAPAAVLYIGMFTLMSSLSVSDGSVLISVSKPRAVLSLTVPELCFVCLS